MAVEQQVVISDASEAGLLYLDAQAIINSVPLARAVDEMAHAFAGTTLVPPRHSFSLDSSGSHVSLVMPAFSQHGEGIVKVSTIYADNRRVGQPTIQGLVILFSDRGTPIAVLDGSEVTKRRTAATSALASRYLSRVTSESLVLIGTGELAPTMAAAHCAVRPIKRVTVWGRRKHAAEATRRSIAALVGREIETATCEVLRDAVSTADIVCCATSSVTPVLMGRWLRPGTFVDAVGSFTPEARETDDDVVLRSRVFVDTLAGAMSEAGDLLSPISRGVVSESHIVGELADLVRGKCQGRLTESDITFFKSVGSALEDLAIATLLVTTAGERR